MSKLLAMQRNKFLTAANYLAGYKSWYDHKNCFSSKRPLNTVIMTLNTAQRQHGSS